jgi:hypothetical protein
VRASEPVVIQLQKACFKKPAPRFVDLASCRNLPRDLRSIIAMATRKDPRRRYLSVERFAADIERYLVRRPVTARRGSLCVQDRQVHSPQPRRSGGGSDLRSGDRAGDCFQLVAIAARRAKIQRASRPRAFSAFRDLRRYYEPVWVDGAARAGGREGKPISRQPVAGSCRRSRSCARTGGVVPPAGRRAGRGVPRQPRRHSGRIVQLSQGANDP